MASRRFTEVCVITLWEIGETETVFGLVDVPRLFESTEAALLG